MFCSVGEFCYICRWKLYIRIALFGFQSATLGVLSLKKLADIAICSKQFINFALLKTSAQAPPFILRHELSTL
jgi:hypothetical protein